MVNFVPRIHILNHFHIGLPASRFPTRTGTSPLTPLVLWSEVLHKRGGEPPSKFPCGNEASVLFPAQGRREQVRSAFFPQPNCPRLGASSSLESAKSRTLEDWIHGS
jgi:hypothetical protein